MTIREMWRRMTATRYTRALEAEVAQQGAEIIRQEMEMARLRRENRALLNSILGIAGIPPIPVGLPELARGLGAVTRDPRDAPTNAVSCGAAPLQTQQAGSRAAGKSDIGASGDQAPHGATGESARVKPRSDAITPMRRRSWQQITRMLEFESARKTVTSD